jgi:release factor glutamine methyltransferase
MTPPATKPTTIHCALSEAAQVLQHASTSPALDAEVLLSQVVQRNRAFLRAWPERPLTAEQAHAYGALIASRLQGTPIAYLTASREFWSREFLVTPEVLIPRPDTELLVELALQYLSARRGAVLLDLATGSGAIAVTLAAESTESVVYASDVSTAALKIARRNAERHHVTRIGFLHSDWFEGFPGDLRFDLIVSNPPYIAEADPHLGQGDVRFEPTLALRAGPDGLAALRVIAAEAGGRLIPGGRLLLEHGYQQADELRALLSHCGYRDITHHPDLQGHLRVTEAAWPDD